jgi:hypothetical protein
MGEEEPLPVEGALAAGRYADEDDRGRGDGVVPFPVKEKPTKLIGGLLEFFLSLFLSRG